MVAPKHSDAESPVIAFAGGGTGGHLYPALAIARALRALLPRVRLLFFGTERPIDRRVIDRTDVCLIEQPLTALRRAPWRWPGFVYGFHQSTLLCRSQLANQRPAVVIGTGGLGSVPAVREAARAGIPTALLNPDAIPGRANRHLAGMSDVVFVQWSETAEHFEQLRTGDRPDIVVSGCPVRPEFNEATREAGVPRFGLDPDRKTLLITGASQGAQTVNRAVVANLEWLDSLADEWQVLHLTGATDYEEVVEAYRSCRVNAVISRFTDHMAEAVAAADLIIGRAGASSLAEITAMGRAAILMPYPYHKDQHQLANARCLVRASAARIVHDKIDPTTNGPALQEALEALMADGRLRGMMAESAQRIGNGQAAWTVAQYVLGLARRRGTLAAATPVSVPQPSGDREVPAGLRPR